MLFLLVFFGGKGGNVLIFLINNIIERKGGVDDREIYDIIYL